MTAPSFRVFLASLFVHFCPTVQDVIVLPLVTSIWRHESDSAVKMFAVVPADEFENPLPCGTDIFEAAPWVARAILACTEHSFSMGVVIAHAWP